MLFDKYGARSGSPQLITKTVQLCGQAYSKINDIHTYLHVTCLSVLLEHGSKLSGEQFWAQNVMLALSSGSYIGRKQQRERGEEKSYVIYHSSTFVTA